jgi:hypothetical protein
MAYETNLRNKNRGYMQLVAWQKAMDLFELVWAVSFIECKIDFKLRSQPTDAAQSVSANIYEVENRLLRLIEKIEAKRDTGDWTARIAEDPEEHDLEPLLQHSLNPALQN